ncbi:hypothetical protein [uncultured Hyphomicrobium sp.]|uniref:hypothetical protein n=1 Tax=uncultured Hyphomicrobium sp. TaxID=194373 RepID=UPI0025EDD70E|nr:hypothetical protein [uncultured Hyphomicrobium sp.]
MLTVLNLFIYGFVALVVLPLAVASLATGSKPPENTMLTKYYNAEKHLMLAGNLFLLAVGAIAILKLVQHFALIDASRADRLEGWINVPFFALLVAFLFLFVRAHVKVRRANAVQ